MAEAPEHIEKRNHVISAFGSIAIHTAILFLFFWWKLSTPIPPYPEGGGGSGSGIEVNLGSSETGFGQVQPEEITIPKEVPAPQKQVASNAPEKIMTQEVEDEDAIDAVRKKEVKKNKPVVATPTPEVKKPEKTVAQETPPVVKKPVVNPKALFKPRTNSQGITSGSGDQGNPNGSPKAVTYTGQGKGGDGGGEGAGGGTGGGIGAGTGKGIGPGVSFSLEGRSVLSLPKPNYTSQVEGSVVVEVTVDKEGRVVSANPGYKGSTTMDEDLLQEAKKAALSARFDRKPDAPAVQKGTITYKFRLQ